SSAPRRTPLSLHDALPISPDAATRSLTASAAASAGTVGCVRRPYVLSGVVDSCVSSQSIAWPLAPLASAANAAEAPIGSGPRTRSEEHTSELQSRVELVCR